MADGRQLWSVLDRDGAVLAEGLSEADARLMAAAPALLEGCRAAQPVVNGWANHVDCVTLQNAVNAAVAEAVA